MMLRLMIATVIVVCGIPVAAGTATAFEDPDWPCVQRKVAQLSWGQMWSGPALPEAPRWREDATLAELVPRISARRTDIADVEALVGELLASGDEPRDATLARLFAGVFELINHERSRLIEGITRYARRQRALSERIDEERLEIDRLRAAIRADDYDALDRIEELEDRLAWDTRIYQDRQQSLTYVCESPVILEKRAFAVARIIQSELSGE